MFTKLLLRLFAAFLYACLEFAAILTVFIYGKSKEHLNVEVSHFMFGMSLFDLTLLGVLRFVMITFLCIGVVFNESTHTKKRLLKWQFLTTIFGCIQATYVVMKVVFSIEDNKYHIPKRFWSMICLNLVTCITFPFCSRFVVATLDEEDSENQLESGDSQDKMNLNALREAQKLSPKTVIKELFKFGKSEYLLVSLAFLCLIISSVTEAVVPYYTGMIVNYVVIDKSAQKFHQAILYMAFIKIVAGVFAGLRGGLLRYSVGRYSLRLRQVLFSKLLRMEIGFFDERKTGELASRLTSDVTKIDVGIGLNLNIFVRSVVQIFCIVCFMLKLSWKMSIVSLVVVPIIAIISHAVGTKYVEISEGIQNALGHANKSAVEAISSIKTVRSFATEKDESDRYSKLLNETLNRVKRGGMMDAGYQWATETITVVMSVTILYYGGHLVLRNELSGGILVSFMLYNAAITRHFQEIGDVYNSMMEIVGALKNIFFYINRSPLVKMNGGVIPPTDMNGHVEFKEVSFSYPSRSDITVLKNINITAEKGEVVALVGPSGSGKSTVINLLQHFYEPTQGEILIDNISVRDYDHDLLHTKMSLVQQEPVLFARSVSENIKYGLKCAVSDDDVSYSAKLANAHEFITSMPGEYETQTGEKGVQMSGGQKQRIAIARALIRNPAILLLDEATSALDSESEYLVQKAIDKNLKGKTVIIIAHRLSTVEKADKIIVIDGGEIVEGGRHHELMEKQGTYAALVEKQLIGSSGS